MIANNWDEANEMLLALSKCSGCIHFKVTDLFNSSCSRINRAVHHNDMCECFSSNNKKTKYQINKLVQMLGEYDGMNDFIRQLNYHEANGTENKFLYEKIHNT
ncbi:Uncharacterised protein [Sphingobacterium multivorum]|uniref:hypothetical protein n=1 Tax=Sphingobacterium multivorum TaxID=28454 RepID=UPI000DF9E267|nr:hypothetical protein [Sphingobacterium multivorum]QQT44918.1 hypothetical protein I6J00_25015 [Sphingobacterium multivorum]SUJ18400.1 Uncharacterised protein [Sphingobacterium multivorum]